MDIDSHFTVQPAVDFPCSGVGNEDCTSGDVSVFNTGYRTHA